MSNDNLASAERASRRSRVTVKDLARQLGMSVSTVSRAFYLDAVIAPETRERVLSKASEIGYQPNPLARGLITKSSRIVGVVVSDITNPFYPEVLTSLTAAIQAVGFNVMLVVEQADRPGDHGLAVLLSYHPDIVIILATTLSSGASEACRRVGTPVIFFNRHGSDRDSYSVTCDNLAGGKAVADLLLDRGFERLAFVAGKPDASTNLDRWTGFSHRCLERGAPAPATSRGRAFSYEDGYEAAIDLLRHPDRPQAIFCANDILAVGAIDAARRDCGLRIPEDLSVVGFDDIAMASWPSYDLTTVRQPVAAMVASTIDLAVGLTRGEAGQPSARRLPGQLVERGTTRRGG
ncbi:MAG TPA: LacI family DNA-binding transcriptional regulator [Lichenihabitans sp.]|nr:LacI family DNA-binding transcriptional regulator [Lichenihabitans sp.]